MRRVASDVPEGTGWGIAERMEAPSSRLYVLLWVQPYLPDPTIPK